ncbi:hypothetical protein XENOCAPTIV_026604 [Xenoophorus captivus]|uniref:Uncharacterized protein n=1 Tax=Xenoophorus captivus TaxID=1517983 RepID=A0ABV0RSE7_9TELE
MRCRMGPNIAVHGAPPMPANSIVPHIKVLRMCGITYVREEETDTKAPALILQGSSSPTDHQRRQGEVPTEQLPPWTGAVQGEPGPAKGSNPIASSPAPRDPPNKPGTQAPCRFWKVHTASKPPPSAHAKRKCLNHQTTSSP